MLETYLAGKDPSPDACEDFIFANDEFIAVIDGATDKIGLVIDGSSGGRFVARNVSESLLALAADASSDEWTDMVTDLIRQRLDDFRFPANLPPPSASAVVFSAARQEIWRVGDCSFVVNGVPHVGGKKIDETNAAKRAAVLLASLRSGFTVDDLLVTDPGRAAIMEDLRNQHVHANNEESAFGYPVLNGVHVPRALRERPVRVRPGDHVALLSDGFDFAPGPAAGMLPQVADMLAHQAVVCERDPLRIGAEGLASPSTKGLRRGMERHDDQAFVSFVV